MQALRLAISPELSAALARQDLSRAGEMYRVSTQWVLFSSWPLYLLMGVFAPTVLGLFGPSYPQGATALSVLCAAMLVALAAGNVGSVLLMGGKSTWVLGDKILALTVNVAANLILIPRYGITGAAVAGPRPSSSTTRWPSPRSAGACTCPAQPRYRPCGRRLTARCSVSARSVRALWGSTLHDAAAHGVTASVLYAGFAWWQRDDLDLPLLLAAVRRRPDPPTG